MKINTEYLREKRKERGLTQDEMADRIGTSRVTFNRLERGLSTPSLRVFCRWAQVLGASLDASIITTEARRP